MKISELAEKAGVAASTIRYYEEQGLLEPASRHQNGYRFYTERAVQQLRAVRISQSLGFTLDEIRMKESSCGAGGGAGRESITIGSACNGGSRA